MYIKSGIGFIWSDIEFTIRSYDSSNDSYILNYVLNNKHRNKNINRRNLVSLYKQKKICFIIPHSKKKHRYNIDFIWELHWLIVYPSFSNIKPHSNYESKLNYKNLYQSIDQLTTSLKALRSRYEDLVSKGVSALGVLDTLSTSDDKETVLAKSIFKLIDDIKSKKSELALLNNFKHQKDKQLSFL